MRKRTRSTTNSVDKILSKHATCTLYMYVFITSISHHTPLPGAVGTDWVVEGHVRMGLEEVSWKSVWWDVEMAYTSTHPTLNSWWQHWLKFPQILSTNWNADNHFTTSTTMLYKIASICLHTLTAHHKSLWLSQLYTPSFLWHNQSTPWVRNTLVVRYVPCLYMWIFMLIHTVWLIQKGDSPTHVWVSRSSNMACTYFFNFLRRWPRSLQWW